MYNFLLCKTMHTSRVFFYLLNVQACTSTNTNLIKKINIERSWLFHTLMHFFYIEIITVLVRDVSGYIYVVQVNFVNYILRCLKVNLCNWTVPLSITLQMALLYPLIFSFIATDSLSQILLML